MLFELKGLKSVTKLVLVFKKIEGEEKTQCNNSYLGSKGEIIISESDIDVFQSIYPTIIRNMKKSLGKGSDWITDLVIDHTISISKYNPLAGTSYKITKRIKPSKKTLN